MDPAKEDAIRNGADYHAGRLLGKKKIKLAQVITFCDSKRIDLDSFIGAIEARVKGHELSDDARSSLDKLRSMGKKEAPAQSERTAVIKTPKQKAEKRAGLEKEKEEQRKSLFSCDHREIIDRLVSSGIADENIFKFMAGRLEQEGVRHTIGDLANEIEKSHERTEIPQAKRVNFISVQAERTKASNQRMLNNAVPHVMNLMGAGLSDEMAMQLARQSISGPRNSRISEALLEKASKRARESNERAQKGLLLRESTESERLATKLEFEKSTKERNSPEANFSNEKRRQMLMKRK